MGEGSGDTTTMFGRNEANTTVIDSCATAEHGQIRTEDGLYSRPGASQATGNRTPGGRSDLLLSQMSRQPLIRRSEHETKGRSVVQRDVVSNGVITSFDTGRGIIVCSTVFFAMQRLRRFKQGCPTTKLRPLWMLQRLLNSLASPLQPCASGNILA